MSQLAFDTNIADPDLIPNVGGPPHELFAQWREQDPVHWNPAPENYRTDLRGASISQGFWVLTRHQDVFEASRKPELFSSHEGSPIIWDFEPEQLAMQRASMMGMEPAMHATVKRFVMPPFAPKALAAFEPDVASAAAEIIDSIADKGHCEFVFDVASKLPVYTFCVLMGIPEDKRELVFRLGNAAADIENYKPEEESTPVLELFAYAQELSEAKRAQPDNSMMSMLLEAEIEGQKLDQMQINMFFVVMSIAGHETTRNTAAHFLRLMQEYPEQYVLLKSDLDKYLPNAIDEVLRFSPPVVKFRRTAMEDTEIGGQKIAKGDKIYLSYPAANRDPAVFEDPDTFDITRKNASKHLAFGTGPHVCLGARLAHMQLKHLMKQVITRVPDIHIAGDTEMLRSIWFNAILKMPVEFTPESR
ncbi:MAG: cytochrome P450 [Pseudomonadota bacterium]